MMNGYYDNLTLRESIKDYPGFGEYAFGLLLDEKEFIEDPELVFDPETSLWTLKSGRPRKVELPEEGQVRYFNPETGLPAKRGRRVPEEYGFLPPYFRRSEGKGVRTIIRFHGQYQPLVIDASHELNESVPHIGARMTLDAPVI